MTTVMMTTDTFEFSCPTCIEDLMFTGTPDEAEATCPNCGPVVISPADLIQSAADEARLDADRDERF
jgi:predicted RNA-binding Zn-ribbon protein involved in translation (DUF1610 family)